jgi:hypothetical protein
MPVIIKTSKPEEAQPISTAPKRESIISRVVSMIIMDAKRKIYGDKVVYPKEWEEYEQFCRLVKGGK